MKKLFSVVLVLFMAFVLTACEEADTPSDTSKEEDDIQINVIVEEDETEHEASISFKKDSDILEALKSEFELEYLQTDDGVFLNRIGTLSPYEGSFIHIEKNDEAVMDAINDLSFEDEDTLRFSLAWWDDDLKTIYDALSQSFDFILAQDAYFEAQAEMHVVRALGFLEAYDDVSIELMDEADLEDAASIAKEIFVLNALGADVEELQSKLNEDVSLIHPYTDAIHAMALYGYEADDFIDSFISMASNVDLDQNDHDTLSLLYFALKAYDEVDLANDIANHLYQIPHDNLWGNNASSYAWILMVYTYHGFDIFDEELNDGDRSLIDVFLTHQTSEGSFVYMSEDDDADLMFTTPQAFLALAYLHAHANGNQNHPLLDPND